MTILKGRYSYFIFKKIKKKFGTINYCLKNGELEISSRKHKIVDELIQITTTGCQQCLLKVNPNLIPDN